MSKFISYLKDEQVLSDYLDRLYILKKLDFKRNHNIEKQNRGIDGVVHHKYIEYVVDEKAQLHYLNKDLPTFTFELSYKNNDGALKKGWLFDTSKATEYYFLVTGIFLKRGTTKLHTVDDIERVKVTSVHRGRLIALLASLKLRETTLVEYDTHFRRVKQYGRCEIEALDSRKQGLLYYTEHLQEQPMNVQLKLQFLIESGVAKKINY
jgi:hypothetical protein